MIFWKRSSFIDSVRHSAGCNYFFYLKALQILYFFQRVCNWGWSTFFSYCTFFLAECWKYTGNQVASEDPAEARPSREVTGAEWEVSGSAAAGFDHLCLALFFYMEGEKWSRWTNTLIRLYFNRNQMSPCPQARRGSWNCSRGLDTGQQDRCTEAARKVGDSCLCLHSSS